MDFRYFMANYWWVNASIFKIINIIHLIRNKNGSLKLPFFK